VLPFSVATAQLLEPALIESNGCDFVLLVDIDDVAKGRDDSDIDASGVNANLPVF